MAIRVISLVPSSTETLLALGVDVVACTTFCEQPQLAHVGGTKNPNVQAIVALAPDVVVLDREENRREDADALSAAGLNLFVTDVNSLSSALAVAGELAVLVGVAAPDVPQPEVAQHSAPANLPELVPVFVPIWRRPWMTISSDTYGGSLLAHLGYQVIPGQVNPDRNVAAGRVVGGPEVVGTVTGDPHLAAVTRYPTVDLSDIAQDRPRVILVPSEPYDFSDTHVDELQAAFGSSTVIRVDGQDLFWWGIRTPDAILRLANQIAAALR